MALQWHTLIKMNRTPPSFLSTGQSGFSGQLPSQFYNSFASWIQGNIYMELEAFDDAYGSYSIGMQSAQNENNYQGLLINYLGLPRSSSYNRRSSPPSASSPPELPMRSKTRSIS
jgi:hypothetical protein